MYCCSRYWLDAPVCKNKMQYGPYSGLMVAANMTMRRHLCDAQSPVDRAGSTSIGHISSMVRIDTYADRVAAQHTSLSLDTQHTAAVLSVSPIGHGWGPPNIADSLWNMNRQSNSNAILCNTIQHRRPSSPQQYREIASVLFREPLTPPAMILKEHLPCRVTYPFLSAALDFPIAIRLTAAIKNAAGAAFQNFASWIYPTAIMGNNVHIMVSQTCDIDTTHSILRETS